MKKKVSKATKLALDERTKAFEQDAFIAAGRREEREAQQRQVDRQFIADFFRAVDAATEISDGTVLTACVYVNGGYRDIKIPMASLRGLSGVVRRLSA